MIPLTLVPIGELNQIRRIGGNAEQKKHLSDLGFVPGGDITVISSNQGNLIVNVKNTRVAISQQLASKIMV